MITQKPPLEVTQNTKRNKKSVAGISLNQISFFLTVFSSFCAFYLFFEFQSRNFEGFSSHQLTVFTVLTVLLVFNGLYQLFLSYFHVQKQDREQQAFYDELSSQSPKMFYQTLHREVRRAARYHLPLTLCCLKLDASEKVNNFSKKEQLQKFSEVMTGIIRASDYLGYLDEDSFCVLLCHTDPVQAERFFFRALLQTQERLERSFSAGLTDYRTGESEKSFLKRAEGALKKARSEASKKVQCTIDRDDLEVVRTY